MRSSWGAWSEPGLEGWGEGETGPHAGCAEAEVWSGTEGGNWLSREKKS